MRSLLRWICILVSAIAVMVAAALIYGHTHTQPDRLTRLGFEACNSEPCFMGVTPGLTSWASVKDELQPYVEGQSFEGQAAFYVKNADYSAEGVFGNGKSTYFVGIFLQNKPTLAA